MTPLVPDAIEVERRVSELRLGIDTDENFRWIFTRYYRPIFSFFARRGIPADRCDDLTQEVFMRVYQGIGRFRGDASFETWLFRITWNRWSKELHSATNLRKRREVPLDETVEAEGPLPIEAMALVNWCQEDPLDNALTGERRALLQRELQVMPPQMRRCILLLVYQGCKYREIAALLQISIETVKSHLHQAKTRLKQRLGG